MVAPELDGLLSQLSNALCSEYLVGIAQALHYIVASFPPRDPFFEQRVLNRIDSLVDIGASVPKKNNSHMAKTRVRRLLNRDALFGP
jgi:hypothetical protein